MGVLAREELQTAETKRLEDEVAIANNLEAIGDLIETNLVAQGRQRLVGNLQFSDDQTSAALVELEAVVERNQRFLPALRLLLDVYEDREWNTEALETARTLAGYRDCRRPYRAGS